MQELLISTKRGCVFLILAGMLIRLAPGKNYLPYLRFLMGIMLLVIVAQGIVKIFVLFGGS